jgi:hypothetical protein
MPGPEAVLAEPPDFRFLDSGDSRYLLTTPRKRGSRVVSAGRTLRSGAISLASAASPGKSVPDGRSEPGSRKAAAPLASPGSSRIVDGAGWVPPHPNGGEALSSVFGPSRRVRGLRRCRIADAGPYDGALAELALGARGAVEGQLGRLAKVRIVDPAGSPSPPPQAARVAALRAPDDRRLSGAVPWCVRWTLPHAD